MRKRREKVSVKAAAIILGAALLTAGCSGYQSSEELRKNAENVQAEIVPGEENETENGSDEAIGEKAEKQNLQATEITHILNNKVQKFRGCRETKCGYLRQKKHHICQNVQETEKTGCFSRNLQLFLDRI